MTTGDLVAACCCSLRDHGVAGARSRRVRAAPSSRPSALPVEAVIDRIGRGVSEGPRAGRHRRSCGSREATRRAAPSRMSWRSRPDLRVLDGLTPHTGEVAGGGVWKSGAPRHRRDVFAVTLCLASTGGARAPFARTLLRRRRLDLFRRHRRASSGTDRLRQMARALQSSLSGRGNIAYASRARGLAVRRSVTAAAKAARSTTRPRLHGRPRSERSIRLSGGQTQRRLRSAAHCSWCAWMLFGEELPRGPSTRRRGRQRWGCTSIPSRDLGCRRRQLPDRAPVPRRGKAAKNEGRR